MFPLIKGLSSLRANALCQFFRFFCQITDFLEFAVLDQICFYHPASAAADDLVKSQIIFQILCSDSTCRHKTKLSVWCCHCFDHSHSTCRFCREEFNYFQSSFYCLCHFRRCHTSRENRNFFFQTIIYDFRIESRTYDEFCSCLNNSISHRIRFP